MRLRYCLILSLALACHAARAEEPFLLLCEYGDGQFHSSKNLQVNIDMHTVDSQPAEFTDTIIRFDRIDDGKACHYEINRLNEDFTYSCVVAVGIPNTGYGGKCKKAPDKQF